MIKLPLRFVLAMGVLAACPLSSCAVTAAPGESPPPAAKSPVTQFAPLPVVPHAKSGLPRALWVWDATVVSDAKHGEELFAFCAQKKIARVYLSVGDIFGAQQRGATDPKHITAPMLGKFLSAAHAHQLEVEALDGDPSFALQIHHGEALGIFQKALAYNKSAAPNEKLDGFQWDTEPYILDEFKAGGASQKTVLTQYLHGAAQLRNASNSSPEMRLGFAIPVFFDDAERTIEWNGKTKPVAFHLVDILNTLPSSYIVLMAYRDHALGPNGTVEVSQKEVEYAGGHAPKVKVWIGQETLDPTGDPPSISFYHLGENALEQALGQIQDAFKDQRALEGLAIHHWESYRVLKAGDAIAPVRSAPTREPLSTETPKADESLARRVEVDGTGTAGKSATRASAPPELQPPQFGQAGT